MDDEHFKCAECQQDFSTKNDQNKHIAERHLKETTGWSLLVGDSHVKSIKSRQIEKVLKGNRLRNPAASSPREGSAYTTSREWPGARYPDSNLAERVPVLLNERPYSSLIVLTPSNNITNIENFDSQEQNELTVKTALDTVSIVEKAIEDFPSLEKIVIVELPPRADSTRLSELTEFCNFTLRGKVQKSKYHKQITIANLDNLYDYTYEDIFGFPSSQKYDGIHMKGKHGRHAYTVSILQAIESAGLRRQRRTFNTNTTPETTSNTVPTSNMFDVLSNLSN